LPPRLPPLAIAAFKKLSEASLVPIPQEPMQPLVDENTLTLKPEVYSVYDPTGELQFVEISCNIRDAPGYNACCRCTIQMFQMFYRYVSSVSYGCCTCCNDYTHVSNISVVLNLCCKCFI
jgi:hypothetical protein